MVTLIVVGVSIHSQTHAPLLLLYPLGSQKLLCLPVDPMEAFVVSKALHGFGEEGEYAACLFPAAEEEGTEQKKSNREEEEVLKRSLVHDFILNALNNLDGKLQTVSLVAEKEGFYSAEATIKGPKGSFSLHCRPADAITLALRGNVPILIAKSLTSHAEHLSDVIHSLPEHIQRTLNATLIAESPLFLALNEEEKEKNSAGLVEHSSLTKHKNLVANIEKNKSLVDQNSHLLDDLTSTVKNVSREKTTIGALSDAEQWTDLLSILTPETKKTM